VQHHPRTSGTSKYGLSRIFRVLLDLTTVYFWLRFRDKPMHFMGFLGGICILGSLLTGAFASWSLFTATQRTLGYSMAISNAAPSYVLSAQLLIMGLQVTPIWCLNLQLLVDSWRKKYLFLWKVDENCACIISSRC